MTEELIGKLGYLGIALLLLLGGLFFRLTMLEALLGCV